MTKNIEVNGHTLR